MLTEWKKQDIRKFPAQTIICPVNCVGTMGNGLAAAIKDAFPMVYLEYREALRKKNLAIGKCHVWRMDKRTDRQILLFATKQHWVDDSELEYIEKGLINIVDSYEAMGIKSLAIPPVGCGKGNLKFDDVNVLIEKYLDPLPIPVIRCLRHY